MWTPEKIRALRKQYGESQEEFCHRCGVTVVTFRLWEQGRGQPSGSAQLLLGRLEEDVRKGEIRELQIA